MSEWSPEQYERFKKERAQPFVDLMALVQPSPQMRVVDLGCGTGELTAHLHETLKAKSTLGIDNSDSMLAKAPKAPGLRFEEKRIEDFNERNAYELVFSNAALHWIANHAELFERLKAALTSGGQLAVQMPANFDHPSHLVAQRVAQEEPFKPHVGTGHRSAVLTPEAYAQILHRVGFKEQHVRLQVYAHVLPEPRSVVEWVKGSLPTDYARRLSPELYAKFVSRYEEVLLKEIPNERPFLFTFKRIHLWARA